MRRRFVPALTLLAASLAVVSGCTASDGEQAAVTGEWVSVQDCEGVTAILAAIEPTALPPARRLLADLDGVGRDSKVQLTEERTVAFVRGGSPRTSDCTYGPRMK
jgi:hypothetical protein